jgi:hypothetical protein
MLIFILVILVLYMIENIIIFIIFQCKFAFVFILLNFGINKQNIQRKYGI